MCELAHIPVVHDVLTAHSRSSSAEGNGMRKIIVLATVFVIAAVVVVWSKSLSGPGNGVRKVEATEASTTISPAELMKIRRNLPHEQWDAF